MAPTPCAPPSPSSCSLSPLNWPLQPCNSPALKPKINRCQQLVFWVVAAVLHPHPTPDSMPLGSWFQAKARPVGVQGGLRRLAPSLPRTRTWQDPVCGAWLGYTEGRGSWIPEAPEGAGIPGQVGGPEVRSVEAGCGHGLGIPLHNPSGPAPGNLLSCQLLPSLLREVSLALHAFNN